MAVTLVEASKFTTNMVRRGVLEEIFRDSIILQRLKFIGVQGNAYQYLRENTLGSASFFDPNETWTEDTPTWTQVTANIKIMGGDADVDNFIKATRSDKTDFEAEVISGKTKAVKHTFLDRFWYGDVALNSKEFDGVHKLISPVAAQQIHAGAGAVGAAISMANLDIMIDLVRDGGPACLVSSKAIRRRVNQFIRNAGSYMAGDKNEWSVRFKEYDGIEWYADDFLTMTETIAAGVYSAKTGGVTGSVFALRFNTDDLVGLQQGDLKVIRIGQLESKDAMRHRLRWYPAIALMRTISMARYDGITDVAATA
jgi:hypothetical protein